MSQRYDVDDILAEIRRKREMEGGDGQNPPTYPADRQEQEQRRRPSPPPSSQPRRQPAAHDYTERTGTQPQQGASRRPSPPPTQNTRAPQSAQRPPARDMGTPPSKGRFQIHYDDDLSPSRPIHDPMEDESFLDNQKVARGAQRPRAKQKPAPPAQKQRKTPREQIDIPLDDGIDLPDDPPDNVAFMPRRDGDTQEVPPRTRRTHRSSRNEGPGGGLENSRWQQSYAQQEVLEQPVAEDEFASPQDAPYVEKDLKEVKTGLLIRLVGIGVLTFISLYLTLALREMPDWIKWMKIPENFDPLPLPAFMFPEKNTLFYMIAHLVLCIAAALFCSSIIGGGLSAFFRLRADSDSPAALALLAVFLQGSILMFLPDELIAANSTLSLYFPVAFMALFFTLIGKLMLIGRIRRNFAYLCEDTPKQAFIQIQNRDFAREFARGLGSDVNRVAYSAPADFISGFLDHSYGADYSSMLSRLVTPICFIGGLLVAVITYLLNHSLAVAITGFAAVQCICAPFSAAIVPNLMLSKVSRRLTKRGCMLTSCEDADDYCDTGALILSDKDLFSKENVVLHGMKVFAEKRIDEAILDAASVILSCDGIMSEVFLNMVGGNRKLLKKVDGLIYEDGMGVSAWVNSKRVLIGSRDLMRNHEINCPTMDFENRYAKGGRRVLYIANSGELSAMFVVSYNTTKETADALIELQRQGVGFTVYSTDPNITTNLIASSYGLKRGGVRVLPAKLHPEYMMLTRAKERINVGAAHTHALYGPLEILKAAHNVTSSVHTGALAQLVGVAVGYGLVAFMSFTNSLKLASFGTLFAFQSVCLVISVCVSLFGKKRRV